MKKATTALERVSEMVVETLSKFKASYEQKFSQITQSLLEIQQGVREAKESVTRDRDAAEARAAELRSSQSAITTSVDSMLKATLQSADAALVQLREELQNQVEAVKRGIPLAADIAREASVLVRVPADGKDGAPGKDGIDGKDGERGERGVDGKDGVDGAPGKDGVDGRHGVDGKDGKDGAPGIDGIDGKDGKDGAPGKDGIDGASFSLEEASTIIEQGIKMKMPTVQQIASELEGQVAKWILDFEKRAQEALQRVVDQMPVPKDGVDGLGFDEQNMEYDGKRTFTFVMERGEKRKTYEFKVPVMLYMGIFNEELKYDRGDVVVWGGSSWIALKDFPQGKPGLSHDWQLIAKKGRDGK